MPKTDPKRDQRYLAQWRRERQAAGLCVGCGSERDGSSIRLCSICRDREREQNRVAAQKLRESRSSRGTCVTCGKRPIDPELTIYCLPCAVRARELKRRKRGAIHRILNNKTY